MLTGETIEETQPVLQFLRKNGLSYCLQYNVEEDVGGTADDACQWIDPVREQQRDAAAQRFKKDILDSGDDDMRGFIAIKVCQS